MLGRRAAREALRLQGASRSAMRWKSSRLESNSNTRSLSQPIRRARPPFSIEYSMLPAL
jgi:hypothetical protein